MLAQTARAYELVAIADPTLLEERAIQLGLPLTVRLFDASQPRQTDEPGVLCVDSLPVQNKVVAGQLDASNVTYLLQTLKNAVTGCQSRQYDAMMTAPVHKGIINDAGVAFSGHTEFIADMTGGYPVMMLLNNEFRVSLATTHIPVKSISAALNQALIVKVLSILNSDLQSKFGIQQPRIAVCGLNPHAGESGHIGVEEIEIIEPAIAQSVAAGIQAVGPLPADTLFTPRHLDACDAVLAMYHDQGLPVLKYAGFGSAVNLTLGIPIIRTSVDHGTAIDLAGTGQIETGSADAALALALRLASQ